MTFETAGLGDHPQLMRTFRGKSEMERRLMDAPLVIAVVSFTRPHPKVPAWEQELSAGASAMNIVTAATALGYGANWLTGWPAHDPEVRGLLGMGEHERVIGFVHIGTPMIEVPERERPDAAALLTDWTPG